MRGLTSFCTGALVLCSLAPVPVEGQATWYVDDDAPLGGDGESWPTSYRYLQDAMAVAMSGDEIRVAGGIYRPDQDEAGNVIPGERTETFQLITGVGVYGGYRGCPGGNCEGGDPYERDNGLYETILSGDLNGDDNPRSGRNGSNCCSEHQSPGCDDAVCEAVVCVASGICCAQNWSAYCAHLALLRCSCELCNENSTCDNSYHILTGSGTNATAILDGFIISGGNATSYPYHRHGGGMISEGAASPTLANCVFSGNSAHNGGGMSNYDGSDPTLTKCTFMDNSAVSGGSSTGGAMVNLMSSPTLTDCTFIGNYAEMDGGAIDNSGNANTTLIGCQFIANRADRYGGAIRSALECVVVMNNCTFAGNSAASAGGAVSIRDLSDVTLVNCLLSTNSAATGGGMYVSSDSSIQLINTTFAQNTAENGCAIAFDSFQQEYPSDLEASNVVLWNGNNEVWNNDGSTTAISYSNIQGGWPGEGNIDDDPRFADADGPDDIPGTADDDMRLLLGSPCIDSASNAAVPPDTSNLDNDGDTTEATPLDLDGNPRFVDDPNTDDCPKPGADCGTPPIVDMGAYEFQGSAEPIPTVSEWGLVVMILLLLTAGTLVRRYCTPAGKSP